MPRILVTGFNGFDGQVDNPSQHAVEWLRKTYSPNELISKVLRTEFSAAGPRVRQLIAEHRPAACVCLGLCARSPDVLLERLAVNLMDAVIPDNAGHWPRGQVIAADGPNSYPSTLPLTAISDALRHREIPHQFSDSAGRFVCNQVFYCAADEIRRLGLTTPCGFIHVPWAQEFGPSGNGVAGMQMEKILSAVEACVQVTLESVASKKRRGDR